MQSCPRLPTAALSLISQEQWINRNTPGVCFPFGPHSEIKSRLKDWIDFFLSVFYLSPQSHKLGPVAPVRKERMQKSPSIRIYSDYSLFLLWFFLSRLTAHLKYQKRLTTVWVSAHGRRGEGAVMSKVQFWAVHSLHLLIHSKMFSLSVFIQHLQPDNDF